MSDAGDAPQGRALLALYANYFAVGYNAFEFLLDCGQLYPGEPPEIHTRVVTSPAQARELLTVLRRSIEEFDARFGPGAGGAP